MTVEHAQSSCLNNSEGTSAERLAARQQELDQDERKVERNSPIECRKHHQSPVSWIFRSSEQQQQGCNTE
jgi:hypothetical protein